jgi:D-serine deaminase-like pyridoxal phosphate-dependent protein
MTAHIGQALDALDSPQLLLDLDVVDANFRRVLAAAHERGVAVRVHFKSLKCTGLARYLKAAGADGFVCAKLNEAEALAEAGLTDLFIANQIVGPIKLRRVADLARRARVSVCVDDAQNVADLSRVARETGVTLGVFVEVDLGMSRCGVEPGGPAVSLARRIHATPGLQFIGLQGYQGHLVMLPDANERRERTRHGLEALVDTRRLIERAGIPVAVVTGGGTGNWDTVGSFEGVTEIQPGSFVLMDCAYHAVRPEFGCSLSVLCTVISRRPLWYVLDAGSKAISRDFGTPLIKGRPEHRVAKLSEEHTRVDTDDPEVRVGDRFEVIPAHCCATMNLHRTCVAVRGGRVGAVWPIEASGRYD